MSWERCEKCRLVYRDYLLENGLCPSCRPAAVPEPEVIPALSQPSAKPLPAFFEALEREWASKIKP